jgi:hypothetical protein
MNSFSRNVCTVSFSMIFAATLSLGGCGVGAGAMEVTEKLADLLMFVLEHDDGVS